MTEQPNLAEHFEGNRARLRAVAYRMLGSLSEADDAVQEAWLRADRAGIAGVENVPAWLTTVVARVSLNLLRARRSRREEPIMPDPVVDPASGVDPEHDVLLADAVGVALLVILGTLTPAERLAFVLHDMFAVPFEEIAPMIERSPAAARQLASRARRRVRGQAPTPDPDVRAQRTVVDAFFAAARDGDLDRLASVLHPDVVLRADGGTARERQTVVLNGPDAVIRQARLGAQFFNIAHPALINGAAGAVIRAGDQVLSIMAFTVTNGRIAAIDVLADPDRLATLNL
ncbi:RNA polymerase sigma factor SigJ [Winogradskya consettensis]|uniref:DNA-directed RNA polymerase sigma-70 factor n=1 Tax=Winogradskya consettensis TaxID=113560 RepID=A0A919SNX3_9ACTN|nr:sigma-70 family RNA polymerase sigma factor [Actinoplanes consettensis]GIM74393.1 DNA-directed RNA polymerase sigma-70 factor [Actinoplanes consettensis]